MDESELQRARDRIWEATVGTYRAPTPTEEKAESFARRRAEIEARDRTIALERGPRAVLRLEARLAEREFTSVNIYGLRDPEPRLVHGKREVRYVGATCKRIENRLDEHWALRFDERNDKAAWLRSLGERPGIVLLATVSVVAKRGAEGVLSTTGEDSVAEQRWIDALRSRGHRLTNMVRAAGIAPPRETA